MRKTKKRSSGGDIYNEIFEHILSIGFELETPSVSKLSLVDNDILLNTDTVSKDLDYIFNQSGGQGVILDDEDDIDDLVEGIDGMDLDKDIEDEPPEEDDQDHSLYLRQQELVELDAFTNDTIYKTTKKKDPDVKFNVLNDIAHSKFTNYLNKVCIKSAEEAIAMHKEGAMDDQDTDTDQDIIAHEFKDQLYTFQTDAGKTYKINFEMWAEKDCGTFADVEWVFTYYKPKPSKSIILDTFTNVVNNLGLHLDKLQPIPGKLTMHLNNRNIVIGNPTERLLLHNPNTNLYYLQSHLLNEKQITNDICIVPQMTFSCEIQHAIPIIKEMVKDSLGIYANNKRIADDHIEIIERLETCVEALFASGVGTLGGNQECVSIAKNYVFMILFKLDRYYNNYLLDEKVKANAEDKKYFKNTLFCNSRHYNIELYDNLKVALVNCGVPEEMLAATIQRVVVQKDVLEKYLVTDIRNVRKNAFSPKNILDKSDRNYGNPWYSLLSYFQYFEDPVEEGADVGSPARDWLYFANIDVFSTTMKIRDNVVLIELRSFPLALTNYLGSIADHQLLDKMTNGACNRMRVMKRPDTNSFTVEALKRFVTLYNKGRSKRGGGRRGGKKTMKKP
jgi:hypothetical protein